MAEETFDNAWPTSTRLNQKNRQLFVTTVLNDLMPDEKKPSTYDFATKWGDTLYHAAYDEYLEQMKALPKWMFVQKDEFHVDVWRGEDPNDPLVKAHNGVLEFQLSSPMLMMKETHSSYSWSGTKNRLAEIPTDHEVVQALKDHYQASDDWDANYKELRTTLEEVTEACNTSHQLFRAWPKAVKYAEECFPYVQPAQAKRGGQTTISADQLDLTAKLAQTTIGTMEQN